MGEQEKRSISYYVLRDAEKKFSFLSVTHRGGMCDRESDQTHRSIEKNSPQVVSLAQNLVWFVNGEHCLNRFKILVILNT